MEFEVSYSLENEQQFWAELDEILSTPCETHEAIDNALRAYLRFSSNYRKEYLESEYELARCSYRLCESAVFSQHAEYVRRQFVHSLQDEDSMDTLHVITSFILFDGRNTEETFTMMNEEGVFPKLLELIKSDRNDDGSLHRRLLELVYEMSRIQQLRAADLSLIDDTFVIYLFKIIEELSDDVNDPYHYPLIRVLLVLNEQYMVLAHDPGTGEHPEPLTNRVIKVLSLYGSDYKTFGENIILLLNRESETSLQLLILKLLYLLFTTRSTYEYFYTNDLRVLVDVMIRNLLDLPDDTLALRHTYLRVIYPLLAHTQLRNSPHYKREEILKLLDMLAHARSAHFAPPDETTVRLVARCAKVPWLLGDEELLSPAKRTLGISLGVAAGESSISVVEVAALKERPGVMTKSRHDKAPEDEPALRERDEDPGGGGDGGTADGESKPEPKPKKHAPPIPIPRLRRNKAESKPTTAPSPVVPPPVPLPRSMRGRAGRTPSVAESPTTPAADTATTASQEQQQSPAEVQGEA